MAGRGQAPKQPDQRRTRHQPQRGDWQPTPGIGWQHGERPAPPPRLRKASRDAWTTWMDAWFAAHWTPADLPGLRQVIRLYNEVERGGYARSAELRQMMDNYGITPKGQQDRRWVPPWMTPKPDEQPSGPATSRGRFAHLKVVNE